MLSMRHDLLLCGEALHGHPLIIAAG